MKKTPLIYVIILLLIPYLYYTFMISNNPIDKYNVGDAMDSVNHVIVYYNGGIAHEAGENTAADGYVFGVKHKSKEFVNRYYYEHFNHKMPSTAGKPSEYFLPKVKDGYWNKERRLTQYHNPSKEIPKVGDIVILKRTLLDGNGQLGIVTKVNEKEVEIIQQNPGPSTQARRTHKLIKTRKGLYKIKGRLILGWLRK